MKRTIHYGLSLGTGAAEQFPERLQRLRALAIADEKNRPAIKIHHKSQVFVSFTDTGLVYVQMPHPSQCRTGKPPDQITLENLLRTISADTEQQCHIFERHDSGQVKDVVGKSPCIAPLRLCLYIHQTSYERPSHDGPGT